MSEPSTDPTQIQSSGPIVSVPSANGFPTIPGYDLQPEIARGGMGVVYRARDLTFDREVAIKVMKSGMNTAEFAREASITARLPHPGIPPAHAMGTLSDGRPYLVMKLIQGETLDTVLKRRTEFVTDRGRMLGVFEQVCQAVGYAHSQGIIHRDLKPSNIMVGAFGEVQVMDWGLAKKLAHRNAAPRPPMDSDAPETADLIPADAPRSVVVSMAGVVKGTPAYMAPEQARGEVVDLRADVFSLGGILTVILTGHPPFEGKDSYDTILRAAREELDDTFLRLDSSGADADLLALCKKCLMPWADGRYADATELARAMAEYIAESENRLLRQVQRERDKLAVFEYGRTMQVAHLEWRDGNFVAMRALLDSTDPNLRGWEWGYLNRQFDTSLLTLKGHTDNVLATSFSTDGTRVVTGSADETAKVWNARTGAEVLTLKGHTGKVSAATFNPDGTRVVTGSWDGTAKVWDAQTGAAVLTLKGHKDGVLAAMFSPDGTRVVTGSWDGTAKVWDARTGAEVLTLKGHGDVNAASFSADGTRIVTGSDDQTAKVWNARTGAEVLTLKGHTGKVSAASFSPDGTRVVTGSSDGSAKVWDAQTGAAVLTLKGIFCSAGVASFNPDGTRIVTESDDQTAKVWDAKTGAEVLTLKGHTGNVLAASFSPDGTRVVTGSWDRTAKVWDARTGADVLALKGHTGSVNAASFSADGTRVVTGSNDQTAKVWDAKTGAKVITLKWHTEKWHTDRVLAASFSGDGTRIVTGSENGTAKVWEVKTGSELLSLGHTRPNPKYRDEDTLSSHEHYLTSQYYSSDPTCPASVTSVAFSADGMRIVTLSDIDTVKVWDARTGAEVITLKGHTNLVTASSLSADGTRIVARSWDNTAKVWDARTGADVLTLRGHTCSVTAASFSPDGTLIVTGSWDNTAKVWDAKTGAEVLTLKGHTRNVSAASFSPDGTRIVTGSWDKTAKVWDAKTGAEVLTLKGHTDGVSAAAFSPDGTRIVTGSEDKTAKVWDSRPMNQVFLPKGERE